jgi:hypothetical protein
MNTLILISIFALGLSESIEPRLPQDPGMIYTVGFEYNGVNVGLDWKNRQIVPHRTCRKSSSAARLQCQQAAVAWLREECAWYGDKAKKNNTQTEMESAVCSGAKNLAKLITQQQLADR